MGKLELVTNLASVSRFAPSQLDLLGRMDLAGVLASPLVPAAGRGGALSLGRLMQTDDVIVFETKKGFGRQRSCFP